MPKEPFDHALADFVAMFVPLRILELQQQGGITDDDLARVQGYARDLCEHGDAVLFQVKGHTGRVAGELIDALAVLAHVPGGVPFAGHRFEATPASRWMRNKIWCGALLLTETASNGR